MPVKFIDEDEQSVSVFLGKGGYCDASLYCQSNRSYPKSKSEKPNPKSEKPFLSNS
jgi:hypothetical protein